MGGAGTAVGFRRCDFDTFCGLSASDRFSLDATLDVLVVGLG